MKIIEFTDKHEISLIELIARFRIALGKLKQIDKILDLGAAKEELKYYLEKQFHIYLALNNDGDLIGYTICRIEDNIVWDESLYVVPEERRRGVASALFLKAEELAKSLGGDTLYNWVHPNNHRSIPFLKKHGYDVLNLVEVRKKLPKEELKQKIKVGKYEFDY